MFCIVFFTINLLDEINDFFKSHLIGLIDVFI